MALWYCEKLEVKPVFAGEPLNCPPLNLNVIFASQKQDINLSLRCKRQQSISKIEVDAWTFFTADVLHPSRESTGVINIRNKSCAPPGWSISIVHTGSVPATPAVVNSQGDCCNKRLLWQKPARNVTFFVNLLSDRN